MVLIKDTGDRPTPVAQEQGYVGAPRTGHTCAKNKVHLRNESTERPPGNLQLRNYHSNNHVEVHFLVHLYTLNYLIVNHMTFNWCTVGCTSA